MNSRLNRCFALVLGAFALMAGSAFAQSGQEPVQGLIVKLKPQSTTSAASTASTASRASATESAQRESSAAARVRLIDAVRAAGVVPDSERSVGSQGHHLLRLASAESGSQLQATLARLRQQPDVLSVEPDVRIKRMNVPNDPGYSSQWHLQSPTVVAAGMNMPLAWDTTTGSSAITVAVLDTGVRFTHPDLAGRVLPGYDFVSDSIYANDGDGRDADATDPGDWVSSTDRTGLNASRFASCDVEASSWHGTFISGQIAAVTNNSQGIAGLTWAGSVLPVRVAGKCGALLSDLLDGLRWAAGLAVSGVPANTNPARIINLSFGGDQPCTAAYQDVIDEITNAGALLVVAAGNESAAPARPADCKRVLTVAAAQADGRKTSYSNLGAAVGILAPGGTGSQPLYSLSNTGTTVPLADTYAQYLGTSFSAPQAAGVASLMLAVNPSLTPDQLVLRLKQSARPHVVVPGALSCTTAGNVACNCSTATCGAGLLDAATAVASAAGNGYVTAAVIAPIAIVPVSTTLQLDGSQSTAFSGSALRSYQWSQVSGAAISVQNATTAVATITLPVNAGSFTFTLTVTDTEGRTAQNSVTVVSTAADPGVATTTTQVSSGGGGGGGAMSWLWGLALWAWVSAVWISRRRARK